MIFILGSSLILQPFFFSFYSYSYSYSSFFPDPEFFCQKMDLDLAYRLFFYRFTISYTKENVYKNKFYRVTCLDLYVLCFENRLKQRQAEKHWLQRNCQDAISHSMTNWIELDWIGLDWIGLDWIGLDPESLSIASPSDPDLVPNIDFFTLKLSFKTHLLK